MARTKDNILNDLVEMPWQVSVGLAAIVYVGLRFILPFFSLEDNSAFGFVTMSLTLYAPYIALFLLIPAPISALNAANKRKRLESQKDIKSIRELSWKEFEELVAEAYRRKGYSVTENPDFGPDGGVDIRLTKNGQLHLVQCKQWKSNKVGVAIIREMFGVMTAQNAASVIVVTSGIFTQEARNFALGKPIDLVDGGQLVSMIHDVQVSGNISEVEPKLTPEAIQYCPRCGAKLVKRIAKKGKNAGKQFWGCSKFPSCRFTESLV